LFCLIDCFAQDAEQNAAIADLSARLAEANHAIEAMKHHIDETEARVISLTSELQVFVLVFCCWQPFNFVAWQLQQAQAKFAQDLAEATEERASIKERMNEAIQERWIAEEQLKKIELEREKAASGSICLWVL
jgi:hypothetical protein